MVIYTVEIVVPIDIQTEWIEWMTTKHIPEIMKTGYFNESRPFQVVDPETPNKVTFEIRYDCKSLDDYRKYRDEESGRLAAMHSEKFGEGVEIRRRLSIPMQNPEGKVAF